MQRILSQKNIIKRGSQTCYRYMIATFAGKTDNVSSLFSQFTSWGGQALLPLVLGEAFPDGPNSSGWWISCLINYLATIHIYVDNMYKYIYILHYIYKYAYIYIYIYTFYYHHLLFNICVYIQPGQWTPSGLVNRRWIARSCLVPRCMWKLAVTPERCWDPLIRRKPRPDPMPRYHVRS